MLITRSDVLDEGQSIFVKNLHDFVRDRLAFASLLIVLFFFLLALFAPLIAPHDPYDTDLMRRLQPPFWLDGGEISYFLGCDALGRDILSRLIFGSRISISIALAVVFISVSIGTIAGLIAGYKKGVADILISRLCDILLGFPYLIFAIGLMAMMGPGFKNIILALAYKEWVEPCRVVRGETLVAREMEYVEASKSLGASSKWIMFKEILPNILSPIIVVSTFRMAYVIITEASLSFLGIGVQPPTASWGAMVSDGREFIYDAWWISTFPGVAILILVLSINVGSQGLRDAFDPRFHR